MHEHGIADHLFEEALTLANKQGKDRIVSIKIGIGALSGLDAEALREAINHVAHHFDMAGVDISFTSILPAASCPKCAISIGTSHACPLCGSRAITITAGLDASVLEVS
jgi:Zn finger protein HypA/HybF involved in hydrogenase expression